MTDFKTLLFRAGFMNFGKLERKAICEFLLVSERTLERWLSKNVPCPRAVKMLEIRIDGKVSNHPNWSNFKICRDGYLWTPSGKRYEAEYINKIDVLQRSNRYHEAQSLSLQNEITHLRNLVSVRTQLKEMGQYLIAISDRFKFEEAIANFSNHKPEKLT
ncbi:hypothetical protein [Pseudoalteromonas xiamenensis]|uniref:Uncharacterized protein n=1 Tax=Pseudoalteromonas xiamenensis TaxID=882626 RepID=A0A975DJV4_9GAMM|nr:hypothetical protein [Pseudoalteromonas xiamenensis]QTH71661.1 hypothetical protein J5O05_01420 [Pseudoalteromonas xiamenensis]